MNTEVSSIYILDGPRCSEGGGPKTFNFIACHSFNWFMKKIKRKEI